MSVYKDSDTFTGNIDILGYLHVVGPVTFDSTFTLDGAIVRVPLAAARTYYVLTTGSDSNTGLVNNAGGAFLTIQHAINIAVSLDLSIYSVTIQVGAGTFTGSNTLSAYVGTGPITIVGAGATTIISTTSANCFTAVSVGNWNINSLKMVTATSGYGIQATNASAIVCTSVEFGTCADGHINTRYAGQVRLFTYKISGNATYHWLAQFAGSIIAAGTTITLTGTPAISLFAAATDVSMIFCAANTFSGTATGTRYDVESNSVVDTGGGGATYLPGNVGGSTATGGQYI